MGKDIAVEAGTNLEEKPEFTPEVKTEEKLSTREVAQLKTKQVLKIAEDARKARLEEVYAVQEAAKEEIKKQEQIWAWVHAVAEDLRGSITELHAAAPQVIQPHQWRIGTPVRLPDQEFPMVGFSLNRFNEDTSVIVFYRPADVSVWVAIRSPAFPYGRDSKDPTTFIADYAKDFGAYVADLELAAAINAR